MGIKNDVSYVLEKVLTKVLVFVWIATTIVVAMAGPFGTFNALTFPYRFVYWAGVIAVSIALAIVFRVFWYRLIPNRHEWVEDGLVIGSLALAIGPMVSSLNMYLWPDEVGLVGWQMISLVTFAIGLGTVVARHLVYSQSEAEAAAHKRDRLLERIGAPLDARLARISSDNHHIRIITSDEEEYRVLMRLRDAVADIDIEPGFCVHRSHWVALSEISGVEMAEGREIIRLTCGGELPVGPKYRSNLIGAGVLSD